MEDPWAAGPSWPTLAKGALPGDEAIQIRSSSPAFSPTPAIDGSDPWGAPSAATPASALPASENEPREVPSPPQPSSSTWHADAGHGGWGEESHTASPQASPPHAVPQEDAATEQADAVPPVSTATPASPAHEAVWSLDSPGAAPVESHDADHADIPDIAEGEDSAALASSPIGTPPRSSSFANLPSVDSPHDSMHSRHSFHSPALSLHEELTGGFGESSLPKSPSFGDEGFGGFTTGFDGADPWGGGAGADDAWGSPSQPHEGFAASDQVDRTGDGEEEEEEEDADDAGDGWGASRTRVSVPPPRPAQETEWEHAQRMIRVKQERAPDEKIHALRKEWEDIAQTMIGLNKLDKPTEEEERQLEAAVRKLQEATAETLRSLGSLPEDLNTYAPVISSLVTHERHVYALSRPNPAPSTSLLKVPLASQSRQTTALNLQSSGSDPSPWLSRSKLGEPDAPASDNAAQSDDAPKGRWSFWSRKAAPEKQLTTSGGGVLEVKALTPTSAAQSPAEIRPASTAPSLDVPRPPSPPPPVAPAPATHEDVGHDAPSETPQGPSVVSRFFGRLSRRSSSQAHKATDIDGKDLELSADDFSFLDQVPSITSPPSFEQGMGDLLAMEPGRDEQIAGLESILAAKPTPLPAPLAPPPRGPSAPAYSRSVSQSSTGGRFVPRMAVPAKRATDMDLLSGLDFAVNASSASTAPAPVVTSPNDMTSASISAWDEFLAPSRPTPPPSFPTPPSARATPPPIALSPAVIPPPPAARATPPPVVPSPVMRPAPTRTASSSVPSPLPLPFLEAPKVQNPAPASAMSSGPSSALPLLPGSSRTAATVQSPPPTLPPKSQPQSQPHSQSQSQSQPQSQNFGFGDVDDFGTPQGHHTAAFEDFGDFSAFDGPQLNPAHGETVASLSPPPSASSLTSATPLRQLPPQFILPISKYPQSHPHQHTHHQPHQPHPQQSHQSHQSQQPHQQPQPHQHPHPTLDHTPTVHLVNGASALKGRRWPAPPSPVAPILEPPPSATRASTAGFPFLSPPPPPSRPTSSLAKPVNLNLLGGDGDGDGDGDGRSDLDTQARGLSGLSIPSSPSPSPTPAPAMVPAMAPAMTPAMSPMGLFASPVGPSPGAGGASLGGIGGNGAIGAIGAGAIGGLGRIGGIAPTPPRAATPAAPLKPSPVPAVTQGGLSAQDLSFFDSL